MIGQDKKFDEKAAKEAGYSDAEIANFLAKNKGFDIKAARATGS